MCSNFYADTVCALSRFQLKAVQREDLREDLSGLLLGPTNARVPRTYEDLKMALVTNLKYILSSVQTLSEYSSV